MTLTEADTRAKLIDPAIHKCGWTEDFIRREETAGAVEPVSGRRQRGQIDYVLRFKVNAHTQPVALALIEAKRESLPPGHGLDQGKGYAACKRLNVRFVFSSNGHQFVEYDHFTGQTSSPLPMSQFPTPEELRTRYEHGIGFALESPAARPLLQPYSGGEGTRRYYQDAAIRAVMEHIAQCEETSKPKRALLSMATGCGKTFIAVNLLKRIADAGQLTRALFLCDRDELRSNAIQAFQNAFGADAAPVYRRPDGTNNARNARIHVATYQTLGVADDQSDAGFLNSYYPENHFTHVVIDECHRSAWGKWSQVLVRNSKAVQIGLTATPRQLKCREDSAEAEEDTAITANNIRYFGEPVYEYGMGQGIEDGYLAACEVQKGRVNLDDKGLSIDDIMKRGPKEARTGISLIRDQIEEHYAKTAYEDRILLPDRVEVLCRDLFQFLLTTGNPEQKTIIFCVRDSHADDVAARMSNLYADWCTANGKQRREPYAFKCTAASSGNDQLPDFRASSSGYFIATTVDLLTTGVDVPCVRNIVFFKYLKSPISFYQMIGRGTRIDAPTNKLTFRVYDYTDATRLFSEDFTTRPTRTGGEGNGGNGPDGSSPTIRVEGFDVHITDAGRFIVVEEDGHPVPVPLEEYKAKMAERLVQEVRTLDDFRTCWINPPSRQELIDSLVGSGYPPTVIRQVEKKEEYDLYDVLAELGWGLTPRTCPDRVLAFRYKHEDWLDALPGKAANTIRAIAGQFERGGTEALENTRVFQVPMVRDAGGISALQQAGTPRDLLTETKRRMFAA